MRSLQRLIPKVQPDDLFPAHVGVCAQALMPDGGFVDDFLILHGRNSCHIYNAPFPAATAFLEIGRAVVEQIPELRAHTTVAT